MDHTYWHRQRADQPLYPDLVWSRPETKAGAGKLAIIGGNAQSFAIVAEAYNCAQRAGVGATHVLLPDSLLKTVGKLFPEAQFAPSSPSGSFAKQSLSQWLELSQWADGMLLAGGLGRNSETAILLEQFLEKYDGQLTLTGDSLDYFTTSSSSLFQRPQTLIAPTFSQLQKLLSAAQATYHLASGDQFIQQIEILHRLSAEYRISVILPIEQQVIVAVDGQISTTPKSIPEPLELATPAAVWWLQNPNQTFEALTSSVA